MTTEPTLADYPHQTFDKLRYGDTDRLGHVNNAVFSTFLETGRVSMLFDGGTSLIDEGCDFVIARLELDFRAEILWPGTVEIGTRIATFGRSSLTLEQVLFQNGRCTALAKTVMVQMDMTTRRSRAFSEEAIERLKGTAT